MEIKIERCCMHCGKPLSKCVCLEEGIWWEIDKHENRNIKRQNGKRRNPFWL